MPVCSALYPFLALCVSTGPAAGAQTSLPSGDSDVFRHRMTGWSAPAPQPGPAPPQESSVPAVLPRLSSGYGYRDDPLHGGARMHYGLDIPGALGTPVFASSGGFVTFAGPAGSYGQMVEIDHGGGLSTRYAHLSRLLVRPGERIGQREVIALMGSTGRSTGSHLHFEVRVNGRATNPLPLIGRPSALPLVRIAIVDPPPHVSDFARRRAAASDDGIKGAH